MRLYSAVLLLSVASALTAQVTFDRILNSSKEPQNWLTYSGDYSGHRFSTLDQINVDNVKSMVAKGEVELALFNLVELPPGVRLAGPVPAPLQEYTSYETAVLAK